MINKLLAPLAVAPFRRRAEESGRWRYTDEPWVQGEDHAYGRGSDAHKKER